MDNGGIRIAISVFVALIWFPISLYLFMIPYRIYLKEDDNNCLFYVLSVLAAVFFFIWSIADFADANGWVMLGKSAVNGKKASAFFSFFSALFSTIIAILSTINMFLFCKREVSEE